jgi:hypothetical protein
VLLPVTLLLAGRDDDVMLTLVGCVVLVAGEETVVTVMLPLFRDSEAVVAVARVTEALAPIVDAEVDIAAVVVVVVTTV